MRPVRDKGLLIAGSVLLVAGIIGVVISGAVLATRFLGAPGEARLGDLARPFGERPHMRDGWRRGEDFETQGERLYFTGIGRDGRIPIEWDPPTGTFMPRREAAPDEAPVGCALCHGFDARGTRVRGARGLRAPDIRYSTLRSERERHGETEPAWNRSDIASAIREGVTPTGRELDPMMPRWDMNDRDLDDLLGYLRGLE